MASYVRIPLDQSAPWYTLQIALGQVTYNLELAFNTRRGTWTLNIYDIANTPLLMSIPLLIRRDLTRAYHTLNIPSGAFVCLDDTGDGTEPGLGSFLLDHSLYYVEI